MIKVVEKSNGSWVVYENDIPKAMFPKEQLICQFTEANEVKLQTTGVRSFSDRLPLSSFQDVDGDPFANIEEFINYISNSEANMKTGFGFYKDAQYTEVSPFVVPADTLTVMPNNAAVKNETQLPSDVLRFYDEATSEITPKNVGDNILMNITFKIKTANNNTWFKIAIDIGTPEAPWLIFPNTYSFPRGVGTEHEYSHLVIGFSGENFVPNKGKIKMLCNNPVDLYDVSYVIERTHKAR